MTCRLICGSMLVFGLLAQSAQPDLVMWGPASNPRINTRTFTANSCDVLEGCAIAGTRRLLIFDTETRNIGRADLALGSPVNNPLFEFAPCHSHYHFRDFADYRLLNSRGHDAATGMKVGFCLLDSRRWDTNAPANSRYSCDNQGIQAGWADIYGSSLPCQWIDITTVAPGAYTLHMEVDPENRIIESNNTNNITRMFVVLDGPCVSAPANDHFANATILSGRIVSAIGANSCATRQSGEPLHAGLTGGRSIWFQWTPDYTGVAVITTFGSTVDTLLGVYRGTAVGSLVTVASNDDVVDNTVRWSRVSFAVTNGVTYMIAVDGFSNTSGGVAVNINPSQNDAFTQCLQLAGSQGSVASLNVGATNEWGEPLHGGYSLWYCWTAPSNGPTRFHTHGSTVDTRLTVYEGSALSNLVLVASNEDAAGSWTSAVLFNAVAGTTYRLAVGARDEGLVALTWERAVVPRFASITRDAAVYRLLLSGRTNDSYVVQYSPDLVTWQTLGATTNYGGNAGYTATNSGLSGFYRAILRP